jgi:dTDP-4-dehydrorhamnose reductase
MIFRTAWVYAAHGHNFLRTMLRLGAERERLEVVDDQRGTPTPAGLIAGVTATALRRWLDRSDDESSVPGGTYHLVAAGETSWCGFAAAIMERAVQAGLLAHAPEVAPIASADFPTRAQRPAWSVLDTTRLRDTFGIELPPWEHGLDTVIAELAAPL